MSDNDDLKIVVRINREANPELYDELKPKTRKNRTERFRTLATMALMGKFAEPTAPKQSSDAQKGNAVPVASPEPEPDPVAEEDKELEKKKLSFKDDFRKINF